jgi:hypothetical protein
MAAHERKRDSSSTLFYPLTRRSFFLLELYVGTGVQEKDKIIERKVHRDQELITGLITDRWA